MRTWVIRSVAFVLIASGTVALSLFFCTQVLERGPIAARLREDNIRELAMAAEMMLHLAEDGEGAGAMRIDQAAGGGAIYMLFDSSLVPVSGTGHHPRLLEIAQMAVEQDGVVGGTRSSTDKGERWKEQAMPFTASSGERYYIAGVVPRTGMEGEDAVLWVLLRATAILVAGGILLLLTRMPQRPAKELRKALRRLAHGEYNARVNLGAVSRGDELAKLAFEFNAMAEQMESLHAEQQRLFGEISHEMRSPLSRMSLAVELAGRSGFADPGKLLDRIRRDANRLGALSNEMLDLAKAQRGAAQTEVVDVAALVEQVIAESRFEAESTGKRVVCGQNLPGLHLQGNREMLFRMLENVVRNGIRHTPLGTEVIVDFWECAHAGRETVTIRVRDAGSGVAEEDLQAIFRPFVQAQVQRYAAGGTGSSGSCSYPRNVSGFGRSGLKSDAGGATVDDALPGVRRESAPAGGLEGKGLGLAITRHVAVRHGGMVWGENGRDGGLQVFIRLPLAPHQPVGKSSARHPLIAQPV
ncbi:ATP-binding protein [Desulfovibrio psychrotolerans]|uniref:Signal transduction histidine-protein kinase/phosphatase MprB n=1 Tax=Desulfovibrio psychrotolerans TaxID=415242 RepID=A0A7J0BXQ8_9BACT|nr:ATP-binding protein [Desulfovibrio psychrotolerans]GFM38463.1 hypothetical protein DSM19430T_31470 [Desulfovibrio psychrotolerans]